MKNNWSNRGRRTPTGKLRTTAYNHICCGTQLRPNARMPISNHREVGKLLKSLLNATDPRTAVYSRVDSIRAELDEWAMREYDENALDFEALNKIYYWDLECPAKVMRNRDEMAQALKRVQEILSRDYPNCVPVRSLLRLADKAFASVCAGKI